VQALVLCPTRELAEQVSQEIRRLARAEENIKVLTLCGGTPIRPRPTAWPTAPTSWWARRAG
jgi:ATP-independent RNA helicase DbpA